MTGHKNDLEAYAALVGAARFANKTVSTEPALPVETVTAADCRSSVTVLASGSGGNATLVCCGSTKILIDAGISYRRITNALAVRGYRPDDIDALFLTHEHTDHVQGLPILKYGYARIYDGRNVACLGKDGNLCTGTLCTVDETSRRG